MTTPPRHHPKPVATGGPEFSVLSSQFSVGHYPGVAAHPSHPTFSLLTSHFSLPTFPPSHLLTFALLLAILVLPAAASAQANSARDCAVCHLNWVNSFQKPRPGILLIDPPPAGVVSESAACLGCHDGSIADSRRRVWNEHGHATGIKPPPGMTVPNTLPLQNGAIQCRTCHTAHVTQGPETLANTVFLRMNNDNGQLCASCHADKTKGPELGTHPVGGMPWPVPDALLAAGAKRSPDPQRLTCQTCHTPHGAREDHLLVMGTQSSQLCLTCHSKLRPGLWRAETGREHPQNPPLDPIQRQAVTALGTKVGDHDTLICLSCHKLHHGRAGRNMLADTLQDSQLCLRCHPGRAEMFKTKHDLRVTAPQERNRLGQTPTESGPCGACHSFHQFARRPDPQPLDPSGLCVTCHQKDRCAGQATGLPFSHPTDIAKALKPGGLELTFYASRDNPEVKSVACLTCHNPHETQHPHFLRADSATLCSACHSDIASSMGKAHDFSQSKELVNGRGQTGVDAGKCGFCHGIHNAPGPKLWVATAQTPQAADDLCVQCHSPTGLAKAANMTPLRHPSGPNTANPMSTITGGWASRPPSGSPATSPNAIPLFDATGHHSTTGFIACATCHDPHGGANGTPDLLRQSPNASGPELCANCHTQADTIHASLHRDDLMTAVFPDARFCAPCHAVHEKPNMPPTGTWSAPLGPADQSIAMRRCTGCHEASPPLTKGGQGGVNAAVVSPPLTKGGPGGVNSVATPIIPTIHPPVPMANVVEPGGRGYLPLFDETGRPGPAGMISCETCHLPHGTNTVAVPAVTIEQLRGLRIMVRPYSSPNVCSSCHGFDGLRRYLYYHDPVRRRAISPEARP